MNDIRQHYAELLELSDSLLDNLAGLIERVPPPETARVNWGHIGKLLDFNRQLSEASYDLHKHIDYWRRKEAEHASANA